MHGDIKRNKNTRKYWVIAGVIVVGVIVSVIGWIFLGNKAPDTNATGVPNKAPDTNAIGVPNMHTV